MTREEVSAAMHSMVSNKKSTAASPAVVPGEAGDDDNGLFG